MPRIRQVIFLVVPLLVLPVVFIYDVIRVAVDLEMRGSGIVRELAIILSFGSFYLYYKEKFRQQKQSAPKTLGRTLLAAAGVLAASAFILFFKLLPTETVTASSSAVRLFVSTLLASGLTVLSIHSLLVIREFIFFKRRESTRRNYIVYVAALIAAAGVSLPFVPTEWGFIDTILVVVVLMFGVMNAFRQNWIVYLSRREKIYTIVYSILLFVCFIFLSAFLSSDAGLGKSVAQFSHPIRVFVRLQCMVCSVYFGMAFASTLFHLPTADVFERKQSELSSLHSLSRLVTQVLDFNDLVNSVTAMTIEVVGAQQSWLELIQTNEKTGEVSSEIVSTKHISPEQIADIAVADGPSVRDLLQTTRRVMYIENMAKDKRVGKGTGGKKNRGSMLSVPLVSHGTLIGVLHATKESESAFDQDDIDVLSTFADNVTVAIDNSRLIARSIERERLQQELMLARTMQQRLLPQTMPVNAYVEFAAASESSLEVGGDYFDFASLPQGRIGIIVGDVSGKGITAAFYMAEVKGIFLSLSKLFTSPKELLIKTNQALRESIDRKAFISVVYALIDPKKGSLTLARAGHCPAILCTTSGAELVRPNGLGLGLADDELFAQSTEECTYTLKPGDVCVFYTDGITEARDAAGEEFGYERLAQLVADVKKQSAEEIKSSILQSVKSFMAREEYRDDMTLVVLKWKGPMS